MWMSQPCRSSCMNGTFTSYAAVLMMPAGQAAQQRTIRRAVRRTGPSAARGRHLPPLRSLVSEARVYPAGVELVDLGAVGRGQAEGVDVAAGVVEVMPCLRVDAADGSDHLRAEQYVAGVDDVEQQGDAGLVVHAGVEEDVAHHRLLQRGPAEHVGQSAEASPVVRDRSTAVRDDQPQAR